MAFDKVEYDNRFQRENYDRMSVLMPKGRGIQVKMAAAARGLSVSQLIAQALESQYNLDLSKPN